MKSWLEVSELRRLLVFGAMGSLNTAICYALFATLVKAYAWHHNAALVIDYGFGIVLGFALHRWATFADRTHLRSAMRKYAATLGGGFLLDLALLNLLMTGQWLGPLSARAAAVLVVTACSYLLQKHWVFRSHAETALANPGANIPWLRLSEPAGRVDERGAA
jgi:putative flippase GtrA